MKDGIIKFGMLVLLIFLSNSCKVKPQVFGYGEECERANSIAFAKAIFNCVGEDKIIGILDSHNNDNVLGLNIAINSKGEIVKIRLRDDSNKLNNTEIREIIDKLREGDSKILSCMHDNYFKADKEELLKRVVKNYKGGNIPVYIIFPGNILSKDTKGDKFESIKKHIKK